MIGAGALPQGGPPWLTVAGGVVLLFTGLFGAGAGRAAVSGIRQWRRGMATRETEARRQMRELAREHIDLTMQAIGDRNATLEDQRDEYERRVGVLWDHVGVLEAWIIDGKGAPPPRRPVFDDRRLVQ